MSQTDFSSLDISPELLKNIESLGYTEMTPIQAQSLPCILEGKDLIGQAKTGSGKTAAFGLGLINRLKIDSKSVEALILCPTRELADQVSKVIRQLARTLPNIKVISLCGGMPFRDQTKSLQHGAHIVVGTPGRICKHLRKETLDLQNLKTLVLDEADRMLEMGFQEELDSIFAQTPKRLQTLLFSATYPKQIQTIAHRVMQDPVTVKVESTHDSVSIQQYFYKVANDERFEALTLLLQHHKPQSAVIFCNTKKDVHDVTDYLLDEGFDALDLHGDLDQTDRDETLVKFINNSISILVATDVAARGLDIDSIEAVINFHISRDFEVHVHRIGRTGRAGGTGIACSLYSDKESHKMTLLQEFLEQKINSEALPPKSVLANKKTFATMRTIRIKKGKKQKVGPVNILGALTAKKGLTGKQVGKITVCDNWSYVAVEKDQVKLALSKLSEAKLTSFLLK
ncbi:MAG: ATP-dependent RNA helicase DbpA [Lentisphaeraceae bacterium]|nr:ATP-dependent RNA helicase DbpA [Lentisphaeraceae bacterium]